MSLTKLPICRSSILTWIKKFAKGTSKTRSSLFLKENVILRIYSNSRSHFPARVQLVRSSEAKTKNCLIVVGQLKNPHTGII